MYCSVMNHVSATELVWMNILTDCSDAQSCRAPSAWWQPSETPPALLDFRVLILNLLCSCCVQIWLGPYFALSTQSKVPLKFQRCELHFIPIIPRFHMLVHIQVPEEASRGSARILLGKDCCAFTPRGGLARLWRQQHAPAEGWEVKEADKMEKLIGRRKSVEEVPCMGTWRERKWLMRENVSLLWFTVLRYHCLHLSHHLTVTCKWLFLLHLCFSSLLDDLQWKLERVHSLIFFNILVVVVLYLKLFVYTKFLPAQLN